MIMFTLANFGEGILYLMGRGLFDGYVRNAKSRYSMAEIPALNIYMKLIYAIKEYSGYIIPAIGW